MKIEFEVWFSRKASKELRLLRPVFEQLSKVHEDYTNAEPSPDFSFWYSERPQIGLLSAAAWLCGKTALEEYAAPKENGKKRCRGDLYIRTGKNTAFECEAKYLSANLAHATMEIVSNANKNLDKAARDARLLKDAGHYLGLCFVTPWINGSKRALDRRCRQVIEQLKPGNTSHADALVWIHGPKHERKSRRYPGLLLAVKEATKAKRRGNYGDPSLCKKGA